MPRLKKWLYAEESASDQLRIATTAMHCDRDWDENRKNITGVTTQILQKHPDVELIVFGEMILGWYDPLGMQEYYHKVSELLEWAYNHF